MNIYYSIRNMEMKNFHLIKANSMMCNHSHQTFMPKQACALMEKRNSHHNINSNNNHSVYEHLLKISWYAFTQLAFCCRTYFPDKYHNFFFLCKSESTALYIISIHLMPF